MGKSSKLFVGMDVHKESIDVATGDETGGEVRHYGAIGGDLAAVSRLARKMESSARGLVFVYEAGPCGFGIDRLLRARGHDCWVVSPGLTPRSTARCAEARPLGAGRGTYADPRARCPRRGDARSRARARGRRDHAAPGAPAPRSAAASQRHPLQRKTAWTPAHRRWIAELKFARGAQHIAFEEYGQPVDEAGRRIERLGAAIREELSQWRWRPVVEALQAFRGIRAIHAVRLVAELGDLTRFASAPHLMGYLRLVPSENSTGTRRRQGAITKTGNSSARRALVEAAWAYRYGARVSVGIARRHSGLATPITELAWRAQLRLCTRFRRLSARGLHRNKIVVAVARELAGFVWALGQQVQPA